MWLKHGFEASNLGIYLPVCLRDGPILLRVLLKERFTALNHFGCIPSAVSPRVPSQQDQIKETWALVWVLLASCCTVLVRAVAISRSVSFCLRQRKRLTLALSSHKLFRESSVIADGGKLFKLQTALQIRWRLWSCSVLNGNDHASSFWIP